MSGRQELHFSMEFSRRARPAHFARTGNLRGIADPDRWTIIGTAMLKFQCERCGERIAVQPRHLNQLVCCPQCGNATHPLAGQILTMHSGSAPTKAKRRNGSAKPAAAADAPGASGDSKKAKKSSTSAAPPLEECANCGRPIGRLQKAERWDGKTVCSACAEALARESLPPRTAAIVKVPTPTRVETGSGNAPPPPLGNRMRKAVTDFRNGIIWALVAVAVAVGLLYLLLSLLRSLGGLMTAAALLVGLLVVGYFGYRAYAAVRRKLSTLGDNARSIVKLR
jgi:predicted RNA-binding Zn-ribbon protein involved in translation (DUF1610 family)